MEVRNTPPEPPTASRTSDTLIEDLCLALRKVAVWDYHVPNDRRVVEFIEDVRAIQDELRKREVNYEARIRQLSGETGWQMETLLEDCLGFPATAPYVREKDGVRRRFRCPLCGKAEFPVETQMFLCDGCIDAAIEATERQTDVPGLFLYRTYTPSRRCPHADDDTVLWTVVWSDEEFYDDGRCKICLLDEKSRRSLLA
jgi:hypothetical protein